ncbi:RagB/SusD family nutrient uptake outer membrane protein [Bacteroides sedimenti]|uniref:RagB/SusD family nutrient uptake outer membrane protein n=1 Tax=Bacteroides sedimenti TaxID=2136147 RepID=A0ABN6Z7J2_9BACE
MNLKINKYIALSFLTVGALTMSSCNDFLDREPLSSVTPQQYLNNENDLASYALGMYNLNVFSTHGGWGVGTLNNDNGTDNQATANANYNLWVHQYRQVPNNGENWEFSRIRNCNYFFEQVMPKWKAGIIQGSETNIKQYIGEMYFFRAWEYFSKLQSYGDYPIVTRVLKDQQDEMVAASKRSPRNEVARYIIQSLDSAVMYLQADFKKKNRITRNAALLVKSRVALYEATFETYHKGTPRVPGEPGWPGANMDYNKGKTFNIDGEIKYFIAQAKDAAKQVADNVPLTQNNGKMNPGLGQVNGFNPYFDMFNAVDMSTIPEVLLWRAYGTEQSITHGVSVYIRNGGNTGVTKALVDNFLMKNGLPIYAAGSGYDTQYADTSTQTVKVNRDERLQLFLAGKNDVLNSTNDTTFFGNAGILNIQECRDITGYRLRKCFSYDPKQAPGSNLDCTYGSIVFRAVEAYLNYIEASCLENGGNSIDPTADAYWKQIRARAGVNTDYTVTVNATDLTKEDDWGVYSAGKKVSSLMYNIRRERRCELMGESVRMMDLKRWRALDQVKNYIVRGFNLWDHIWAFYTKKPDPGKLPVPGDMLIYNGGNTSNVSPKTDGKYLCPYRIIVANNKVYSGYNWDEANYLDPVPYRQIQLASPNKASTELSTIYQNPYWPVEVGGVAMQ